jgi:SAM-dependent methyltransferase
MKVDLILDSLGAESLKGGAEKWGRGLCPLTKEEMNLACFSRGEKESLEMRNQYDRFLSLYDDAKEEEKNELRAWAIKEFLHYTWNARDFGIRPRWTWDNFLSRFPKGSNFLDVGPCHGIHSNLIYKDYYKAELSFFSAELQLPYLQLQKILGVDARFFDASMMRLTDVYNEESMDAVLFTEVLEHLSQDEGDKILEGLCRVLRPGGRIMISFPVDARPFDFFTGEAFGHQYQPDLQRVTNQLLSFSLKDLSYTKLWSGKTYQHVIIGTRGAL